MVYEEYYRCLTCGAGGRTDELLRRLDKTVIKYRDDDDRPFYNPFSKWLKQDTLSNVLRSAWEDVNNHLNFGEYFYKRGVAEEFRYSLGLGYRDGWYTIPVFNTNRKIIGAVARVDPRYETKRKYMQPHGQSPTMLYCPNWRLVERGRIIVLTFGIFDAITLAINGVAAFSSLTGKSVSPALFDQFHQSIYIWPDKGEEIEAGRLAAKLGWRGNVVKVDWPDQAKDVNEIWTLDKSLLLSLIARYK